MGIDSRPLGRILAKTDDGAYDEVEIMINEWDYSYRRPYLRTIGNIS
jgi:hypothetical protein